VLTLSLDDSERLVASAGASGSPPPQEIIIAVTMIVPRSRSLDGRTDRLYHEDAVVGHALIERRACCTNNFTPATSGASGCRSS
jgi:hypothetical protein